MNCLSPVRLRGKQGSSKGELFNLRNPDGLLVPCGKCMACKIKKREEWAMRCLHELESHENSIFITLTYDDEHIKRSCGNVMCGDPSLCDYEICGPSLVKRDLQKFFKRVRRRLDSEHRKIRYFACGEYGDINKRPHYHAIVFGLSLQRADKDMVKDCWTDGLIHFGLAEADSIRYVSQYIDKKFNGDLAVAEYTAKCREPVFKISSLGIGREFVESNAVQLRTNQFCTVKGKRVSLPRYYMDKLGLDADLFAGHKILAECETSQSHIGRYLSDDDVYRELSPEDYRRLQDGRNESLTQHDKNIKGKIALKSRKL